jgi:hypothetical protein
MTLPAYLLKTVATECPLNNRKTAHEVAWHTRNLDPRPSHSILISNNLLTCETHIGLLWGVIIGRTHWLGLTREGDLTRECLSLVFLWLWALLSLEVIRLVNQGVQAFIDLKHQSLILLCTGHGGD